MRIFASGEAIPLKFAFLSSAAGFTALFSGSCLLAFAVILAVDLYLVAVLTVAAMMSDDVDFRKHHHWLGFLIPRQRRGGLLVLLLLVLAIVSGFAGLY